MKLREKGTFTSLMELRGKRANVFHEVEREEDIHVFDEAEGKKDTHVFDEVEGKRTLTSG